MKDLASRYLDGTATDAEVAELSTRLRTDAGARDEYLRLAAVHARLTADPGLWVERQPEPRPARRLWQGPLAAAAIVVLMAALFWTREKAPAVPVATLLRTEDAVWAGDAPLEGGRLVTGPLRLRNGRAMLRLDGGAELLLHGEVDLRLDDGGSVTLLAGEVRAEVPEAAVGFTIHTPGGKVVDLGTEFIASVNRDGQTEVSVVKGEVEVPDGDGVVHRLTTGNALALDRRGRTHPIAARAPEGGWQDWSQDGRDGSVSGRLQAHETFEYPEGDHDPAVLGGGTGWSGSWSLLTGIGSKPPWSGTSSRMEVRGIEGRLAWVSPPGKNFRQRRIARPLDLSKDGVHYVSLAWFEEALAPEQRRPGFYPQRNLVIDLRGADETGPGRVGLRVDSLLRPVIESGAGQGFTSRVRVGENQRMLMIGKILSRRDGEDEVFLRVFNPDDPPGLFEPDSWDVSTRGLRLDAVLDRAVVLSMGAKPRRIEEIRIGNNWHDAVAGWDAGLNLHP